MAGFLIDNMVTGFKPGPRAGWFTVTLREPIDGLFAQDRVTWQRSEWIVQNIRGSELVLRPN
jgi:hypothetical protein